MTPPAADLNTVVGSLKEKKLTCKELVGVHQLQGSRDIRVDSEHASESFHALLVRQESKRNRRSKLQHTQLNIASLPNITVHVYFVVELLLTLDDE